MDSNKKRFLNKHKTSGKTDFFQLKKKSIQKKLFLVLIFFNFSSLFNKQITYINKQNIFSKTSLFQLIAMFNSKKNKEELTTKSTVQEPLTQATTGFSQFITILEEPLSKQMTGISQQKTSSKTSLFNQFSY